MKTANLTPPAAIQPGGELTGNPFNDNIHGLRDEVRALQRRVRNWQRANGALSLIALALTGTVVYLAGNVKVLPYVVEVAQTGQVRTVGVLPQTWRGQTPGVIEYIVTGWLYRMRRVGVDPVMQTEQLKEANAFMTSAAIAMARTFVQERFDLQKKEWTTQIDIGVLLPLTSDFHAVEVEWRERTFNRQGAPVSDEKWKAIINLVIYDLKELKNPRDLRNPLGLFISDFSWTRIGKATS